jgi:AraC family transcriptional regulator of adaptative response / DNA-3-methyladenine glycosylase II
MAAGFSSVRRFNDAVKNAFDMTPTQLRARHRNKRNDEARRKHAVVHLGYRPPYAWEALLAHFSSRGIEGLEAVDSRYIRTVSIGEARGRISVSNDAERNRLRIEFFLDTNADLTRTVGRVRDLLDVDAAPEAISEHLGRDPRLRKVVRAFPGLRFPGTWNVFEALVRAIVGQQVSVPAARTVLSRLVAGLGEPLESENTDPGLPNRLFPEPERLAETTLQPFGLNTARAETINRVAAAFAENPRFVYTGMSAEAASKRLLAIKGIGPWTADYVLLRALRYPDAFPSSDLGALRAAGLKKPAELTNVAESWRPWRGYALLYLWKMLETEQ